MRIWGGGAYLQGTSHCGVGQVRAKSLGCGLRAAGRVTRKYCGAGARRVW